VTIACVVMGLLAGMPRCGAGSPDGDPPLPPGAEWIAVERAFASFPDLNREAVMTLIRAEFAGELAQCKALAVRHLSRAVELMTRVVAEAAELLEARDRDPALYARLKQRRSLEKQVRELAEALRQDSAGVKREQVAELRLKLDKLFELKQEVMRLDVERMAKDLDRLKGLIAGREKRRDSIVDRRLGELLGDEEALKW